MKLHIGNVIRDELRRQGRSASWLARALFCDRSNIYKLFKKNSLDTDLLLRISETMQTNFFACYTELLYRETAREERLATPVVRHTADRKLQAEKEEGKADGAE